jgi:hypothetical protein
MKKNKKRLALSLDRETIRTLGDPSTVVGGVVSTVTTPVCRPPSVPQTGCLSCPSWGAQSNCCLLTSQCF